LGQADTSKTMLLSVLTSPAGHTEQYK